MAVIIPLVCGVNVMPTSVEEVTLASGTVGTLSPRTVNVSCALTTRGAEPVGTEVDQDLTPARTCRAIRGSSTFARPRTVRTVRRTSRPRIE
jgi:hypothetical protein